MKNPDSVTTPDYLKCKYCGLGLGASGRKIPFHNLTSLAVHEGKCKKVHALKTIANFPITDHKNIDAVNMKKIAVEAL